MPIKFFIIILTIFQYSLSFSISDQKKVLKEKTLDLNLDNKRERVTIYNIQFDHFISVSNSKALPLYVLGPDAKVISLEAIDIGHAQRLLRLNHSAGSSGTSDNNREEYIYLFQWNGNRLNEVARIKTFDSHYDYKLNRQRTIKATPTFKDLNGDSLQELVVEYFEDGKKQRVETFFYRDGKYVKAP